MHAKNLQCMVALRGGLDALGSESDLIARLLQWDTFWSIIPSTNLSPEARPAYQPTCPTWQFVRSSPNFMRLPMGFIDLAKQSRLSSETLNLLVRVKLKHDQTQRGDWTLSEIMEHNNIFSLLHRHADFQQAYPCLSAPDVPQPNFEKLLCLAVFLFSIN